MAFSLRYTGSCLMLLAVAAAMSSCSLFDSRVHDPPEVVAITMYPPVCAEEFLPLCGFESTTVLEDLDVDTIRVGPGPSLHTRYSLGSPQVVVTASDLPEQAGLLHVSAEYTFRVETMHYLTYLGAGSLTVHDEAGLLLAVVTLLGTEDPANPPPPPGWQVTTEWSHFQWDQRGCGTRGRQQLVSFSYRSEHVQLLQGDKASIGDYEIHLLRAEEIDYSDHNCLDYAVAELGYVISRVR